MNIIIRLIIKLIKYFVVDNIMEYIENKYLSLCDKPSDINEHLPTLFEYASNIKYSTHITRKI